MELRKAGASYREIASETQVSLRTAWRDVKTELERLAHDTQQTTLMFREMELQRLDRLQLSLWSKAVGYTDKQGVVHEPDKRAVELVLRIMERRARLLGLDAPQQVEMAAVVGISDASEIQQRVAAKLAAFVASVPDVIDIKAVPPQEGSGGNGHGRLLTPSSTG
jgi:hypothetical protein